MNKSVLVVVGVVIALAGLVFTLQGANVLTGSSMSNSTFWVVAGPIVVIVGVALAGFGVRGRTR